MAMRIRVGDLVEVITGADRGKQGRVIGIDAERNRVFGEAFERDPGFFAFYRSMEAYRQSLGVSDTTLVLSPDSEFFRYFGDIGGRAPASGAAASGSTAAPGQPAPAAPAPAQ